MSYEPVLSSEWQVEVDRVTPAEWSAMLDLFEDGNFYQTFAYGAVRWGQKNLSRLVLKRKGEIVAIAQLRIVRPANLRLGMAYLRWGPIIQRRGTDLQSEIVQRMVRSLEEEYVRRRNLLLQIVPNAFEGSPRAQLFKEAFSGFTARRAGPKSYRTFVLDLTPSLEQLRRSLDKKWRNQLNAAERNGLDVVALPANEAYEAFGRMYKQMRTRKTFDTTVDIEEFGRIQEQLPETQRMRILICLREGCPVAGLIAAVMGDSAVYLLGATSDEGLTAKGSYLLQWRLIQELKQKGVKWYDLGGIDPDKNPGVYHFKKGLSGLDICQMSPLTSCNSVLSSSLVKVSMVAREAVRSLSAMAVPRFANRLFVSSKSLLG